jgi:arsenate reductase
MKKEFVHCTGNSYRSQLAEAYLRHFTGERAGVNITGVETHDVSPRAIATMKEDGIVMSSHTSNHVDEYCDIDFDFVITVYDHAGEVCPYSRTNAQKFHHNFPDSAKAQATRPLSWLRLLR